MEINIPDVGCCEVCDLPREYFYDSVMDDENCNFIWTIVNGHKCIICSDDNLIALAQYVLFYNPFVTAVTSYAMEKWYQGMDYWYFLATECDCDFLFCDIWVLFDTLIDYGFIKKIKVDDDNLDIKDVYVFPDYDKFDLNDHKEVELELAKLSFSILEEFKLKDVDEYEDEEDLDNEKYVNLEETYKNYIVDIDSIKADEKKLSKDELYEKYNDLIDSYGYVDITYLESRNSIMKEIGKILENSENLK